MKLGELILTMAVVPRNMKMRTLFSAVCIYRAATVVTMKNTTLANASQNHKSASANEAVESLGKPSDTPSLVFAGCGVADVTEMR